MRPRQSIWVFVEPPMVGLFEGVDLAWVVARAGPPHERFSPSALFSAHNHSCVSSSERPDGAAVRKSMKYDTPKNFRNVRQGQGRYLRSAS